MKRNKRHADWKGRSKTSLFTDDMIIDIEESQEIPRKSEKLLLEKK